MEASKRGGRRVRTKNESVPEAKEEVPRQKRAYLPAKERRRQIIQAAQEVFAESTLQGATTRTLAKAADVNIATLFQHFDSKEELFHAAVIEPMVQIMHDAYGTRSFTDVQSSDELRSEVLPWIEQNLGTMVDIYPLLAAALFSDPRIGRKLYCEQILPLLRLRSEGIRSLPEGVDPEFLCLAGFGIEFAVAMDRFFRNGKEDLSIPAVKIRNIVFSAINSELSPASEQAIPGAEKAPPPKKPKSRKPGR